MAPMYDFLCLDCGHKFEDILSDPDESVNCTQCESNRTEKLFPLIGGYQGSFGGGSTSPRNHGSFKKKVRV